MDSLQDIDIDSEMALDLTSTVDTDTLEPNVSEMPPVSNLYTENSAPWLLPSTSAAPDSDFDEAYGPVVNPISTFYDAEIEETLTSAGSSDDNNNNFSSHNEAQSGTETITPTNSVSDDIVSISSDEDIVLLRPGCSYTVMTTMAIYSSPTGSLHVSEIYKFMSSNFPYYKTAPTKWTNSVRHNLSSNKRRFKKTENQFVNGCKVKGCLWSIRPEAMPVVAQELVRYKHIFGDIDKLEAVRVDEPEGEESASESE